MTPIRDSDSTLSVPYGIMLKYSAMREYSGSDQRTSAGRARARFNQSEESCQHPLESARWSTAAPIRAYRPQQHRRWVPANAGGGDYRILTSPLTPGSSGKAPIAPNKNAHAQGLLAC